MCESEQNREAFCASVWNPVKPADDTDRKWNSGQIDEFGSTDGRRDRLWRCYDCNAFILDRSNDGEPEKKREADPQLPGCGRGIFTDAIGDQRALF